MHNSAKFQSLNLSKRIVIINYIKTHHFHNQFHHSFVNMPHFQIKSHFSNIKAKINSERHKEGSSPDYDHPQPLETLEFDSQKPHLSTQTHKHENQIEHKPYNSRVCMRCHVWASPIPPTSQNQLKQLTFNLRNTQNQSTRWHQFSFNF